MSSEPTLAQLQMDPASLYREEMFTDRRMGSIRVLTPVRADGSIDARRRVLYVGEAQMLTPAGALPLAFEIDATSLAEAVEKFGSEARLAASSIIVPDRMPPGLGGLGGSRGSGLIESP